MCLFDCCDGNPDPAVEYTHRFETTVCDFDCFKRLKLSSQLKYQHETAERHMDAQGFSYDRISAHQMAFLVTATQNRIHRMPAYNDRLRVTTWNKGTHGVRYYRGFNWYDQTGALVIESCNVYVLVDIQSHKPLRPDAFFDTMREFPTRENTATTPEKLQLPKTMQPAGEKRITFSQLDLNRHLNNAFYADILQDFLPTQLQTWPVKAFHIDYRHEARMNDLLQISTATAGDTVYITAAHDRGECFRASCLLG